MSIYQALRTQLEPLLGRRTEAVLQEGLQRLQIQPEALTPEHAAQILKRVVYRELQGVMSAAEAKRQIHILLEALGEGPPPEAGLRELEAALKRFSLYFEWPEVQRFRGLVQLIQRELGEGRDVRELLAEGRELLEILEEKLQSALLRQARDISDLEAAFERVKSVGGPKVRRLEALIRQIKEAQEQETLAPAEVERARALAAELRKLVESSVIQAPAPADEGLITVDDSLVEDEGFELVIDLDQLTPEQVGRIKEIDVTEDRRRLEALAEKYAPLLERDDLHKQYTALSAQLEEGEPLGKALEDFEGLLQQAHQEALAEARVRYEWLAERIRALEAAGVDPGPVHAALALVKESLEARVLPEKLPDLEQAVKDLEAQLEVQRNAQAQREATLRAQQAFIEEARAATAPYRDAPNAELAAFLEELERLEARTQAGEADEAYLAQLKGTLTQLLADLARQREDNEPKRAHLRAALRALPDLPELASSRDALLAELEAGAPDALAERVDALVRQARDLVQERLQALRTQAERFQLPMEAITEAEAQLAAGRFPDLAALERRLAAAMEARRQQVREALGRLETAAQSYKGMGGEALLQRIQAVKARLAEEIPDLTPLREALAALQRQKQEMRADLRARYDRLREAYATYKRVGGETAHQVGVLLNFLHGGIARLDRLGAKGLLEFKRALEEAEKYLEQLELEYTAAQQVAQELKGADLDRLLEVFDPEETPERSALLAPFRVRGVETAVLLEGGRTLAGERPPWLDPAAIEALAQDVEALQAEIGAQPARLIVLTLPAHALIVVLLKERQLVLLAEKPLLSKLITQVERNYTALLEA